MQPSKPESWAAVSRRMYDFGKALRWKWQGDDGSLRVAGYTELAVPAMDDATYNYIWRGLNRGYVAKDSWERTLLKLVIASGPKPIGIGYVGRTRLSVYFPETMDTKAIIRELNTMQALKNNKIQIPYMVKDMEHGERNISVRLYVRRGRGEGPPSAHFAEARRLLDQYLQLEEAIAHRQPVIDWFASKPVIRIPFTSHTRDGKWRK